jgi:hypothetical protein
VGVEKFTIDGGFWRLWNLCGNFLGARIGEALGRVGLYCHVTGMISPLTVG